MNAIKLAFDGFKRNATLLEREEGIKYDGKPAKEVIRQMLDGFCKAMDEGDERRKDLYIAGLMLRFWYVIAKLAEKSPGLNLETTDFMTWLYEAIEYACKYRKWQDPNSNVNAQQCINQCIETIRLQHYYEYNLDKHKANYNTVSFEQPMDEDGKVTLADKLIDVDAEEAIKQSEGNAAARELVQMYLNKDKVVEAIILDTIAFNDTQKITKTTHKGIDEDGNVYKYSTQTSEFWAFKCVQILSNLPENYFEYFMENYRIAPEKLIASLNSIRGANNQKLHKFLDRTLKDARTKFAN